MALRGAAKRVIQKAADEREPFKQGNLSAKWFDSVNAVPTGRLSSGWADYFRPSVRDERPVFVIFSYGTPIAWAYDNEEFIVPDVRYSVTTTNHQNVVRTAVENFGFYADARW